MGVCSVWWITVASLIGLFVGLSLWRSPQFGLAAIIPTTWLFPTWFMLPLFKGVGGSIVGTGIDIKVAVGAACLVLYCFMPGRRFQLRPTICDAAILLLIFVHLVVDTQHEGFNLLILGRAYAEWYLPYVCGRLAFQSRSDIVAIWPIVAGVACLLALLGIVEATTEASLFDALFGLRPEEGFKHSASRWGIKRANGPTMHAIYFGVCQLALAGWVVFAAFRALQKRTAALWVFSPVLATIGIASAASRGPLLGVPLALIAGSFLGFRKARLGIGLACLFGILACFAFREPLLEIAAEWANEAKPREIMVDGETKLQSSVYNRINIFSVYKIAVRRAGFLGFGTQATQGFPINVPVGAREMETLRSVKYIDNTYLLITLRFGFLGVFAFAFAAFACLGQFLFIADRYRGESPHLLAACLGGAVSGVLAVLMTVWMPHEISFPLLWTFGVSSGLVVAHLDRALE